ncbi:hypothetical protein VTK56DRAFT_2651 [Thermocarpiscus australiensis]
MRSPATFAVEEGNSLLTDHTAQQPPSSNNLKTKVTARPGCGIKSKGRGRHPFQGNTPPKAFLTLPQHW